MALSILSSAAVAHQKEASLEPLSLEFSLATLHEH